MNYIPLLTGKQYVSGIYIIESESGKAYIGSAVKLRMRFMTHRVNLQKNKHDNKRLQNFYNKYGDDSLSFRVLEHCAVDRLLEREQYYIDSLNPFFNICKVAGATYGLKPWLNRKHTEETKAKIKEANLKTFANRPKKEKPVKLTREENLQRIASINKTAEARKRSSDLHKGNTYWLGRKHKPETITNRMGALNGRAKAVYCLELDMTFGTAREACAFFGLKKTTVATAIIRKNKILGKYTVQYGSPDKDKLYPPENDGLPD